MKLWHDDVRMPPGNTWNAWARTNEEAVLTLLSWRRSLRPCTEASFDHDLGCHDIDPSDPDAVILKGASPDGDGVDLAWAMYYLRITPPKVTIHSWNPDGAEAMASIMREAGAEVTVRPYEIPKAA